MFENIINTFKYWRYFFIKAFVKLQLQYKQTSLGLLWEPFALLVITTSIALIWSKVLGERDFASFFIYLFIGYYIWTLISSLINDGVTVFEKHNKDIINENKHLLFYIFEDIVNCVAKFFIVIPLFFIVVIYFSGSNFFISLFFFLLGLIFILLSAIGFMATFGTMSLLYRDVRQIIQSIMRLSFLLTPIIWRPERLGAYESYVWLNPFYVYIRLCRDSFLGEQIGLFTISIACLQTAILLILGFILLERYGNAIKRRVFSL